MGLVNMISFRYYPLMIEKPYNLASSSTADLIYHLVRLASQTDSGGALTTAQWAALRYFNRASYPSRTPSGFAAFHATTRGTASQTIRSLEDLEYIRRSSSERDGRSVQFELTAKGCSVLGSDPFSHLETALRNLYPDDLEHFAVVLRSLLGYIASERGQPELGICYDCELYRPAGKGRAAYATCLSTGEPLAQEDIGRLCARFSRLEGAA